MSDQEKKPPANLEGAVGGEGALIIAVVSPTVENRPVFPIEHMFPNSIEEMDIYRVTLMKYQTALRELLKKQIDSVREYTEKQGIPWHEHLQQRKKDVVKALNWNVNAVTYMEDWEDEWHLPECHWTATMIKYVHLCRWALHRKIEKYYKENPEAPRLPSHSKQQTPESLSVFDGDSSSQIAFVRDKHCEQEFEEKATLVVFNRCGPSVLTERQIGSLETALERFLEPQELKYARNWTEEAVKMTRETSDQTLTDTSRSSIPEDKSDPTKPPAPHNSYASSLDQELERMQLQEKQLQEKKLQELLLQEKQLFRRDTLSGIPPLPKDSPSPEESSIDQSEETSPGHTGENTEDEATSLEELTDRRKQYTHRLSRPRSDEESVDTE